MPVPSTSGQTAVDDSEAVFTGLTLAINGGQTLLYAADFRHGAIDVFDANFAPVTLPGTFVAPGLPAGFAPYNVANLGGQLYVTYAQQDATGQSAVPGGGGAVAVFNANGQYVKTLTSSSALDAPWGVAIAPANFGDFSGAVLVGNWGDGKINAFSPTNGNLLGTLAAPGGGAITIDGLRGLSFGNSLTAGDGNALFFTAGGSGGSHGLFGTIRTAQASSLAAIGISTSAPVNSAFSGALAAFTDSNASLSAGSFAARIDWGDGFNSTGTVVALGGGRFNLIGTHTYTQLGLHSATATIPDASGNLTIASALLNVKIPLLTASGTNIAATEDAAFAAVLATFTDVDGNLAPSAYG
ncbi:MAG TPA: TIGR03118 family protein, partial [Thermomicrobiales bacterium]|nr:TIGR03118 family protein [Thermomicrobiales bacterium]